MSSTYTWQNSADFTGASGRDLVLMEKEVENQWFHNIIERQYDLV